MAQLTIVYWRDIPAQVIVKAGRQSAKRQLTERFEKAIDRAAMRANLRDTDSYLAEWAKRLLPVAVHAPLRWAVARAASRRRAPDDRSGASSARRPGVELVRPDWSDQMAPLRSRETTWPRAFPAARRPARAARRLRARSCGSGRRISPRSSFPSPAPRSC